MAVNRTILQIEGSDAPTTLEKTQAQVADLKAQVKTLEETIVNTPTIYAQGDRIDSAGNYNAYNPEMAAAGMTSSGQTPEDAYYKNKVGTTGKTQAQLDAEAGAATAAAATAQAAKDKEEAKKSAAQKAAEAALKVKQEEDAKAAALIKAAADAEAKRIAAEKAAVDARTALELAEAKRAQQLAEAAAAKAKADLEALALKTKQDAEALAAKTAADLATAIAAGNANAIKVAQDAKTAADKAAAEAALAARTAAAEAAAAKAETNINVTGNTVLPFAGSTAADIAAKLAADQALEQKTADRVSRAKVLSDRFTKYNLSSLIPKIKELAINGANEATIELELQETEEYKQRFKANQDRIKKGLSVLDAGTYLQVEDAYRQVLRSYGLKQFDTDEYVSKFISNDMSPTEFSNRIVTAVQRVQNADPALIKQLNDFYGIKPEGVLAYVLDPERELPKIERAIAAGEIGAAARMQGFNTGTKESEITGYRLSAEALAAQGISKEEAERGYATIADILPSTEKLSGIYGSTMDTYGQSEGEQEVFNSLASAQRKRKRLSATEVGTFGASSGMNRVSLTSTKPAGQI